MRTIRRNMILAAAAGLAVSATAQAQLQIVTNLPGAWVAGVDAAANRLGAISQGDDNAAPVTIPAAYATGVLNAGANFAITNGRLINTANTSFTNLALVAAGPFGYYPHWDDLRTDGQIAAVPASGIYALDTGAAFVVQWNFTAFTPANSGIPSGPLGYASMQVQIFPTGSAIVAQYLYQGLGTMTGQSATIGCVTQTSPQVVQYSLNTPNSISNNTVLSIIPVPTVPGACCKPDGTCAEISQFNCAAAAGVYNGDGTLCINQNCPQPGACCIPSTLTCTFVPQPACVAAGGNFTSAGTTCATANCPTPGACCLANGSCTQSTPAACATAGGVYGGNSTPCATANCPQPGACCIASTTTCTFVSQPSCVGAGGVFAGVGITCAASNCTFLGACCVGTGCIQTTAAACATAGGTYTAVGVACAAAGCPPVGACCIPSTLSCSSLTNAACTTAAGNWAGAGITCAVANCPTPGACCLANGSCNQLTPAACTTAGGIYGGDSTPCTAANCAQPGACCVATTGTCTFVTSVSCLAAGGVFAGVGVTCAASNCVFLGACCTGTGCTQTTAAACATAGGTYTAVGTTCAAAGCAPVGACCKADGGCASLTFAACTTAAGVFTAGTTCASFICPGGFGFSKTIPATFTDISATGAAITTGDDSSVAFTSSVTNALVPTPSLFASTNGMISNAAFAIFTNTALPVGALTFALYPDWDDLFIDTLLAPPGQLVHLGTTEGGVPVEIIQWNLARTFTTQPGTPRGTFQVKIWGAGGPALVQYLYQGMVWDWNGNSSTVGVQWSATAAAQRSFSDINGHPAPPGQIPDNSVLSIIRRSACYANCDNRTINPCLNVQDFGCFLNQFAAGDPRANCDNSTIVPVLNVQDFGCFLNKFAAGCSTC